MVNNSPIDNQDLCRRPFGFYFRRFRSSFAAGVISLLFTNALDALPPLLIGLSIDQIAAGQIDDLKQTVGLLVLVIAGLATFRYFWRITWGKFQHNVAQDLRNRVFGQLTQLGPSFYHKRSVGDLMSLMTNDVNSFRMAIGPGTLVLVDCISILLVVPPLMVMLAPDWTWKTLILMPLIPFIIGKIMRLIHERYRQQQDKFAEMSGSAQEIIAGIRMIKGYAQENNQTRLFNNYSRNFELACNKVAKVDAFFTPTLEVGITTGSVILLLVGSPDVMAGTVSVGTFFAFYQYIQRMVWPMEGLGIGVTFYQQGKASFGRIHDLFQTKPDVVDSGTLALPSFESLTVKNLSFCYPDQSEPCLKNISFELRKGETLGILGGTGSGKSTLMDLLCRLYPAPPNTIFINDRPIEEYKISDVRSLVSYAPQEPFLFSRKIHENIAMGVHLDDREIEHVSRLVNIDKEIENIPGGYDAFLGERGINLSGGQRQRLTIARALVRKTPLVILDDSLSAVDAHTESRILDELQSQVDEASGHRQHTTIVVSHRIAALKWADKILILENGSQEALGNHETLMKNSPSYRRIYQIQTNRGEFATATP